jgi:hypothetical protein
MFVCLFYFLDSQMELKKMVNKKISISILLTVILLISLVNAQTETNVCCEKTQAGAWCQNTLEKNCAAGFRKTPTNCQATSFCKPGCCFDSSEGLCMENTPQKVCNDGGGTWVDDEECNIPQCELGCCVLGNQASFVTLTRCKKLSGFFGLQTDFRTNIADELTCISLAALQDQGACVFESESQRTCKFTTRQECLNTESESEVTSKAEFFRDVLCSAEELATNCGPTPDTMCVEGKQEVYFKDSCGNPANIYDFSKINDKSYWREVIDKSESCGFNSQKGNANSASCGNCDYFKGSICAKGNANSGDYYCADLNCYNTQDGKNYKNGESWCIYDDVQGQGRDKVGSRHFRHVCINGEETIEPCDDYRGTVCIQDELETGDGVFTEAACRINRWVEEGGRGCINQKNEEDCLNTDKRDCYWLAGASFTGLTSVTTTSGSSGAAFGGSTTSQPFGTGNVIAPITGRSIFGGDDEDDKSGSGVSYGGGACLPNNPPGLKFWNEGDASGICSLGNSVCVVEYEKGLLDDDWKPKKNKECLDQDYAQKMNEVCVSLGDCGAYVNIANRFTDSGAEWKIRGRERTVGQALMANLRR